MTTEGSGHKNFLWRWLFNDQKYGVGPGFILCRSSVKHDFYGSKDLHFFFFLSV